VLTVVAKNSFSPKFNLKRNLMAKRRTDNIATVEFTKVNINIRRYILHAVGIVGPMLTTAFELSTTDK